MVVDGKIARVDVRAPSPVKTRSGAGIGDTEAQVQALYPPLEVSAHKYVPGGHDLTFVPDDPADADFRLIFETDGSKVTDVPLRPPPRGRLRRGLLLDTPIRPGRAALRCVPSSTMRGRLAAASISKSLRSAVMISSPSTASSTRAASITSA